MVKRYALIEARKRLGLNQEKLAEKIGISRTFYTNIENGVKKPSFEIGLLIAEIVGVSANVLFADLIYTRDVPVKNKSA